MVLVLEVVFIYGGNKFLIPFNNHESHIANSYQDVFDNFATDIEWYR